MDFENEKKQEEQQVDSSASREGYQKEFRPVGRSPRPRTCRRACRPTAWSS